MKEIETPPFPCCSNAPNCGCIDRCKAGYDEVPFISQPVDENKLPPLHDSDSAKLSMEMKPIDIDTLKAVKAALGEGPDLSQLRIVESEFLPDDMIQVSSKLFSRLKSQLSEKKGGEKI